MEQFFICIFVLLAVLLAEDAYGASTLCPPPHRRLASFPPCPLLQLAATSPSKLPTQIAMAPTSDPVPATLPAPVLMDTSSPPLESPQPSPAGGKGWNKAKTGGVAAGGAIAVVGALLLVSKVTSFRFLDASIFRQVKEALSALREILARIREGKSFMLPSNYPVVECGDAKKFIQQYERFARKHKMHDNLLGHVEVYLDSTMREWYRKWHSSKLESGKIPDWKVFTDEFQHEFGQTYEQVLEELENFQQRVDESVADYVCRARKYVTSLDRVQPCLQQQGQVSNNEKHLQLRFLAGLRPNLREKVKAGVKGIKDVRWDVLQAAAEAASFEAVPLNARVAEGVQSVASNLKTGEESLDAPKIEEVSR